MVAVWMQVHVAQHIYCQSAAGHEDTAGPVPPADSVAAMVFMLSCVLKDSASEL